MELLNSEESCIQNDSRSIQRGSGSIRHVKRPNRGITLAQKHKVLQQISIYCSETYSENHRGGGINSVLSHHIDPRYQHLSASAKVTLSDGFPCAQHNHNTFLSHQYGFPDTFLSDSITSCSCLHSATAPMTTECSKCTQLQPPRNMQYSADQIEMWDFEQIIDNSPLSALTADFARFKERFVRMFENGTSGPVYNSDSDDAPSLPRTRAKTISTTTRAIHHTLPQPPPRSHMDTTDNRLTYASSSQYYPESNSLSRQTRRPTPANNGDLHQPSHLLSDIERVKFYTNLQHGGSLDSLKGNIKPGLLTATAAAEKSVESILTDVTRQVERRERPCKIPEKERLHKMKSYPVERPSKVPEKSEKLCKVKSTPSMNVPAKRPTDLPVIPHIITDEYIYNMKTKGFSSADVAAKPKDRYHPRLTQSYLDEHHNYNNNEQDTASTIRDWQFSKSQQCYIHNANNSATRSQHCANNHQHQARRHDVNNQVFRPHTEPSHAVAYNSDYRAMTSHHTNRHDSAFNSGWYDTCVEEYDRSRRGDDQVLLSRPPTYMTQDNRLLEEDSWRSGAGSQRDGACHDPEKLFNSKTTLGATHRGTHKFIPRHADEMKIEIGDSIHVINEADDGWCMGINLTNESQGIFPSVYATDLEFYDVNKDTSVKQSTHKQYKLHFLGSMEVSHHKGSDILVDAIEKVILNRRISKDSSTPPLCQLEVSEAGIKMIDLTHKKRTKKLVTDMNIDSACERLSKLLAFSKETKAVSNHFFSLKNVSFCGYHPENPRYFGFITKHPVQRRFACHCYSSLEESTQPIVDTIGEAFNNYYSDFVPFSDSSEDLYLE